MSLSGLTKPASAMQALFAESAEPTLDQIAGVVAMLAGKPGSVDLVVGALDQLADQATSVRAAGAKSERSVHDAESLLLYLHGDLGFRGNTADYYNVDNSYLHLVIERRLGIPITLACVAIEVGRRLGIELSPIGFPGHFLLGEPSASRFFDPFNGGPVLDLDGCRALLQNMFPGAELEEAHTQPLPRSHVAHRMLNNLKQNHLQAGRLSAVADVAAIGITLPGADAALFSEFAKIAEAVGRVDQAALLHEHLASIETTDAEMHSAYAERLRWRSN